MRCTISTFALTVLVALFAGCRTQNATLSNPFLAPDRVPPPVTRTPAYGTAQPYYQGDPVPSMPTLGAPPATFTPGSIPAQPTYTNPPVTPQPAGTMPPGGWNTSSQTLPSSPYSGDYTNLVTPTSPSQAVAHAPGASVIQVQPDQQSLRFAGTRFEQSTFVAPPNQTQLPADTTPILPTNQLAQASSPVQPAIYASQEVSLPLAQSAAPVAQPREVRIRAISSEHLASDVTVRSSDGFRPQGTSEVRKPTLASRFVPKQLAPATPHPHRFGHDLDYTRLRGQLQYNPQTGGWDLRYAEHSSTDSLGGQVPIANPQVLGGLRAGDFVQLQGTLGTAAGGPAYTAAVVERQRI